ncbi:MAG TPA: cyclic nucleotide-binding domain-containing protein [Mariprofundaceae bacterium]|nr:cyclic nucleotide-binding domain-containing protein [Mariprofundaceae bacterium]
MKATVSELKSFPIFTVLSDAELEKLCQQSEVHAYADGEKLIREGEHNPYLFILRQGTVKILSYGVEVARLKDGSLVGEVSTAGLSSPIADVVAVGSVSAIVFPAEVVSSVAIEHDEFGERIRDTAMSRILG